MIFLLGMTWTFRPLWKSPTLVSHGKLLSWEKCFYTIILSYACKKWWQCIKRSSYTSTPTVNWLGSGNCARRNKELVLFFGPRTFLFIFLEIFFYLYYLLIGLFARTCHFLNTWPSCCTCQYVAFISSSSFFHFGKGHFEHSCVHYKSTVWTESK